MEINFQNLDGIIKNDIHHYVVKVFFEDTDAGQIVYHTNYLKYFERARTSLLNLLKIDQILHINQIHTIFKRYDFFLALSDTFLSKKV